MLRVATSGIAQRSVRDEHVIVGSSCPMLLGLEPVLRETSPKVRILHMLRWDNQMTAFTPALIARGRNTWIAPAFGDFVAQFGSL